MERLDRRAAGVRRLLLPGGVPVPAAGAHEHHQPRGGADAGALAEPVGRAAPVLRAHTALVHLAALPRRRRQGGAQELPGHGGDRLRLPINGREMFAQRTTNVS